MNRLLSTAVVFLLATASHVFGQASTNSFFNWETPPVHPIALSSDGTRLTGAINNHTVKTLDANGGDAAFYRVKSIVDRPFGDFILDDLRSGEFAFANFFGATTNGATFTGATFSQTIMPDGSIRNP